MGNSWPVEEICFDRPLSIKLAGDENSRPPFLRIVEGFEFPFRIGRNYLQFFRILQKLPNPVSQLLPGGKWHIIHPRSPPLPRLQIVLFQQDPATSGHFPRPAFALVKTEPIH